MGAAEGTRERASLLESIVVRLRLPWYLASTIIIAFILLLLLLTAYLDGPLAERLDWPYLRGPLLPVAIVAYVLAIFPLMERFRQRAFTALSAMMPPGPGPAGQVAARLSVPRRRWEVAAVLVGIVLLALTSLPWRWVDRPLAVYAMAMDTVMFAILGLLVLDSLAGTLRISRITRRHLTVDIFATGDLTPLANWSLAISAAFVGGISITIAFQTVENLRQWPNIIVYASLVLVALIVFFLSMWSTHAAIARAKRAELAKLHHRLDAGFRQMRGAPNEGAPDYAAIAAWAAFEHRVQQVSEWPYDARIVRRLAASVLVPGAVYLLKLLFGLGV